MVVFLFKFIGVLPAQQVLLFWQTKQTGVSSSLRNQCEYPRTGGSVFYYFIALIKFLFFICNLLSLDEFRFDSF